MSDGISLLVYPVTDLGRAKALFTALLGVEPYADQPYYVGYRVGGQEIGLDPNGHAKAPGPIGYRRWTHRGEPRPWRPAGRPGRRRRTSAAAGSRRSSPTRTATSSAWCRADARGMRGAVQLPPSRDRELRTFDGIGAGTRSTIATPRASTDPRP